MTCTTYTLPLFRLAMLQAKATARMLAREPSVGTRMTFIPAVGSGAANRTTPT